MKPSTRHVLLWLSLVLLLPIAGPYVLNALFYRPPPRPSSVPGDAVAFMQGAENLWWWAACRPLEAPTYKCQLFDERGDLVVSGPFSVQPRTYKDDNGSDVRGHCRPDAPRRRFSQYFNGEIYVQAGCMLVPREWTYFPRRRTKAAVSVEPGGRTSLAREVPMTEEELRTSLQ